MKYVFHTDAGHGWLEVPRVELHDLGIEENISSYSYQDDIDNVYLEEDCDAAIFLQAMKQCGKPYEIVEKRGGDRSHVRDLEHFSLVTGGGQKW